MLRNTRIMQHAICYGNLCSAVSAFVTSDLMSDNPFSATTKEYPSFVTDLSMVFHMKILWKWGHSRSTGFQKPKRRNNKEGIDCGDKVVSYPHGKQSSFFGSASLRHQRPQFNSGTLEWSWPSLALRFNTRNATVSELHFCLYCNMQYHIHIDLEVIRADEVHARN